MHDSLRQRRDPPVSRQRRSILLVEDDEAVRRSLQLMLVARGHEVRAYPTPRRLAEDPAALRCDCLVADLMLPPTDAIALLGAMRRAGWTGRAIVISGYLDDEWQGKALEAGFAAALAKPVSASTLVSEIEGLPGRAP